MTIQYLAGAQASDMAIFGTRRYTLGPQEHVVSLFGFPANGQDKPFGINGRPGDIYTVPEGRKFTAYQLDFAGIATPLTLPVVLFSLKDYSAAGIDGGTIAEFYPDIKELARTANDQWLLVYQESNDINRPFEEKRQPRMRINQTLSSSSIEMYGIEGPA